MTNAAPVRVADTLMAVMHTHRDCIVYVEGECAISMATHQELVAHYADTLARRGVRRGDRVAVLAQTSHAYIALWHAALLGHFAIVPVNTRLAAPEIAGILENAAPRLMVHDAAFQSLAAGLASESAGTVSFAALGSATGGRAPVVNTETDEDDLAAIIYTGGTTSRPKGVVMTQKALGVLVHRLHFLSDMFALGTCLYTTTPLFHVSGINNILGPFLTGGRVVIAPTFDLDKLVIDVERHRVTHLVLVAAMLDRFLSAIAPDAARYQHLRSISYGGAPIAKKTMTGLLSHLPQTKLQQCYGMTEALGSLTLLDAGDHVAGGERLLSAGRVLPGCAIEVRDGDGRPVQSGGAGEFFARADTMMPRYWNAPDETASALQGGWYRTGDIGRIDGDGYLYLLDRAKDMIITGGENVYSVEVERVIERLPNVAQVAVIGIPSEQWGEQVHAIIVPAPGAALTAEAVLQSLRQQLAGYKCPKSIEIRHEPLPLSGNNKVAKVQLRAGYWEGAARNVN